MKHLKTSRPKYILSLTSFSVNIKTPYFIQCFLFLCTSAGLKRFGMSYYDYEFAVPRKSEKKANQIKIRAIEDKHLATLFNFLSFSLKF